MVHTDSAAAIVKPWVSFCISTYKRPEILKTTLETIARQTFPHFEVIVSDNDPERSASEVVSSMNDERFRYFPNEENLGMIKSFNNSISRATADYITMIADDDPVYPEMLRTLHDLSQQYPGYGVYHGACDVIYETEEMAKACGGHKGINSCMADLPEGHIRKYTAAQFPVSFFSNEISNYMLWSVCVVRKNILMDIGGVPDYGTPFMGDLAFTVLTCSREGAVVINTSLGAQVVHGKNYGYVQQDNFAGYIRTAEGFNKWVTERLASRNDWPSVKRCMENFIGRWMVGYGLSIRKYQQDNHQPLSELNKAVRTVFSIPYLRKWKWKYYIGAYFPRMLKILIRIKKLFDNKKGA